MDGGQSSNSSVTSLLICPDAAVENFDHTLARQIWMGNVLLLASAGITAVLLGIGGYVRRYRHHPLTRFIFVGANTLFLPIISYVVSNLSDSSNDYVNEDNVTTLAALCNSNFHPCMVVTWSFLVQIVGINTTSVVATGNKEGQKAGPPLELFVQGMRIVYLGASITKKQFFRGFLKLSPLENGALMTIICAKIMFAPFVLFCAKFWFKLYAFQKAQVSFALKRNPSLIFGYMQQLQQQGFSQQQGESWVGEKVSPPPLLVMGEYRRPVEEHPTGHVFSSGSLTSTIGNTGLVTLNKVWQLDNVLPNLTWKVKDSCLSFALFKLLRCRFARYKPADIGSAEPIKFFWSLLLKNGEHDRVFKVVGDELSFIHDYYYSSLPISYAKCCLPILSIFISVLSVSYCIVAAYFIMFFAAREWNEHNFEQINCHFWCIYTTGVSRKTYKSFGSFYFDVVPVCLLLVLVLISEVRDMASYICSNWTKVSLICHYVNMAYSSLHRPLRMNKWVVILLQCNCKLITRHWNEKIGQCSVLVIHPGMLCVLRRLLRLPDQKSKVKVPEAVKVHIIGALRGIKSNGCRLSNGAASLRQSGRAGENLLWACNSNSTSVTILTWHIATSIFEVRHPYQQGHGSSLNLVSEYKIAATHLSRYCAYLMTWSPELLHEDVAWSTSLYEAVKKEAERVLTPTCRTPSTTPEAEYQRLVDLLGGSTHEVLKDGVRLGKQLVELADGEETAWKPLAGFWSEMILYVAPSENLKGHSEAVARGGQLVTLLWTLLFHAGIAGRPGDEGFGGIGATPAASCAD